MKAIERSDCEEKEYISEIASEIADKVIHHID